jgi:hypothetical protein
MPLQNGTQKYVELGPDFRRDDGRIDFKLPPLTATMSFNPLLPKVEKIELT